MNDFAWSEKFYTEQVEAAWLKFKMNLADDMIKGLDELGEVSEIEFSGWSNSLFLTAPNGRTLGCWVGQGFGNPKKVAVKQTTDANPKTEVTFPDFEEAKFTNPDEAANFVTEILRQQWQVPHPSFLKLSRNPEISGQESIPDNPLHPSPASGIAASKLELAGWVHSLLSETIPVDIEQTETGSLLFKGPSGLRAGVVFRSRHILEIWVAIADRLDPKIAQFTVLELLKRNLPYKIYSRGGSVFATVHQHCVPYDRAMFLKIFAKAMEDTKSISKDATKDVEVAKEKIAASDSKTEADLKKDEEIQSLEEQLEESERGISERDDEIERLNDEIVELKDKVHQDRRNGEKIEEFEITIERLKRKAVEVAEQSNGILQEKKLLAAENDEFRMQINDLMTRLNDAEESAVQLRELNKLLKTQVNRLQRRENKVA